MLYIAGLAVPIAGLWIAAAGGSFDFVVFVAGLVSGIWLLFCVACGGVLLEIADSLWEDRHERRETKTPRPEVRSAAHRDPRL